MPCSLVTPIPDCPSRPGPSARRAHPCWPPPRPPQRALCSPGRIHRPNPPVLAVRTRTNCGLEAWPTPLEGSGGHRWGPQRCLRNALGRALGQVAGARREACTTLSFLLHDRTTAWSARTGAGGGRSVTEPSGFPAVKPCGHQEAVPAPRPAPLVCARGRGSRVSHW